jgi:hypothetical protein
MYACKLLRLLAGMLVTLTFASWNQIAPGLRRLHNLRSAA